MLCKPFASLPHFDDTRIDRILNHRHSQLTRDYQLQNSSAFKIDKIFPCVLVLRGFSSSLLCSIFGRKLKAKTFPLFEYLLGMWVLLLFPTLLEEFSTIMQTCVVQSFTMECEFFRCAHHTRPDSTWNFIFFVCRFRIRIKSSDRECFWAEISFMSHRTPTWLSKLEAKVNRESAQTSDMKMENTSQADERKMWRERFFRHCIRWDESEWK